MEGEKSDELDVLLSQLSTAGQRHSEGNFSVDFQKAREKMAQYQLADKHHFLLKLIQAGVLGGAKAINVELSPLSLRFFGWDPAIDADAVCDRLVALADGVDDAPSCLAVALNSLSLGQKADVVLEFRKENECQVQVMGLVDGDLVREEHGEEKALLDSLDIRIRLAQKLEDRHLGDLLRQRCCFAPIPIRVDEDDVTAKAHVPETRGKSRSGHFQTNKIISKMTMDGPSQMKLPVRRHSVHGPSIMKGARKAWFLQSVDLRPKALVQFVKAGVVVDTKDVDLAIPGLLVTVDADDCDTDITGMQILENEKYSALLRDLEPALEPCLERAIKRCSAIKTEGQPMRVDKPIKGSTLGKTLGVTLLCLFAGTAMLLSGNGLGSLFLMGSVVPAGATALTSAIREGCAPDDESETVGKGEVLKALQRARGELPRVRTALGIKPRRA